MTTVVEVLNRIARQCRVSAPSNWVNATGNTHVEIRDDFLRETIEDLAKRIDWPGPIGKQVVIAGTGVEDYNLPSDFLRLQFGDPAIYETTTTRRWGVPIESDGDWTRLKNIGTAGTNRYYRLTGYDENWKISLYPNPGTGANITVSYVSANWMANSSGTVGKALTDAGDILLFPRRPVEIGTVARWRMNKGFDADKLMAEYEAWVATTANRLKGRTRINFGGSGDGMKPMRVPVPDFIPGA